MKKIVKYILIMLNIISLFCIIKFSILLNKNILHKNNIKISYENKLNDNNEYNVNIKYRKPTSSLFCSIDNKKWININNCNFNLKKGKQTIYIKNKYNKIKYEFEIKERYDGTFTSTLDNVDEYYLALNGTKKINFKFNYPENYDTSIKWEIENNDIIELKDNTIYGLKNGTTYIEAKLKDGNKKTYKIIVTDLIIPPDINAKKQTLTCNKYTKEENELLDKILDSRVKEAGYGTRGGIIAAARFLSLEFPYYISYFAENGRLNEHGLKLHIDGEGRYYHKGLYLHESKFDTLEKNASSKSGPKIWGCSLYSIPMNRNQSNGLDCSGFVTWAMYNGGFDVGDVGAGDFKEINDDLSDMGKHNALTKEYMKNGNYKVGDFIGENGHAALIIGIDDKNIYTAESLGAGLRAKTYDRYEGITYSAIVDYIIEMDNIYPNGEGNYENMWY